jgi:hypothetical protein
MMELDEGHGLDPLWELALVFSGQVCESSHKKTEAKISSGWKIGVQTSDSMIDKRSLRLGSSREPFERPIEVPGGGPGGQWRQAE